MTVITLSLTSFALYYSTDKGKCATRTRAHKASLSVMSAEERATIDETSRRTFRRMTQACKIVEDEVYKPNGNIVTGYQHTIGSFSNIDKFTVDDIKQAGAGLAGIEKCAKHGIAFTDEYAKTVLNALSEQIGTDIVYSTPFSEGHKFAWNIYEDLVHSDYLLFSEACREISDNLANQG